MAILIFTNTDKTLMLRTVRNLEASASALENAHGPVWSATPEGVQAKLVYDRLHRDMRDLRALTKRIEKTAAELEFEHQAKTNPAGAGNG